MKQKLAGGGGEAKDIGSDFGFDFQYFPEKVHLSGGANWEPQNTTIGVKPRRHKEG